MSEFLLSSLLSSKDKSGRINVALDGKLIAQLSPDEARALGVNFLQAAEAAEQDAMVYATLRRDAETNDRDALAFIALMRKYRGGAKH